MAAIITPNNRAVQNAVAPAPALRADGSNYPWRMAFDGNSKFADADTLEELIAVLFGNDYLGLETASERLNARIQYAKQVQLMARSNIIAHLEPEDVEALQDWEWNVLTYEDGSGEYVPHGWRTGKGELGVVQEPGLDIWASDIPLVLLSTSYQPFTEIYKPMSTEGDFKYVKNIIYLRPETEKEFLRSLSHVGYIEFGSPQAAPRVSNKAVAD